MTQVHNCNNTPQVRLRRSSIRKLLDDQTADIVAATKLESKNPALNALIRTARMDYLDSRKRYAPPSIVRRSFVRGSVPKGVIPPNGVHYDVKAKGAWLLSTDENEEAT